MTDKGRGVAIEGMKTACGAVLIASQNLVWVDDGGAIDKISDFSSTAQNSHQTQSPLLEKREITELYWSYAQEKIRLQEKSRHYTDLNLHIITHGYQVGESVSVTIEYDEADGIQEFLVSATVGDDGVAVIENVFANKHIFIDGSE